MQAILGDEPISFFCEELDLQALGVEPKALRGARYVFSTPGHGDLKPSTAGGMALWAYATSAGGRIFDPIRRNLLDLEAIPFRQHLDSLSAAAFGRAAEYELRYPKTEREPAEEAVAYASLLT